MKCFICRRGETEPGFTTMTLERNGSIILFKNVPAHICTTCDERYFDDDITGQVLEAAKAALSRGVDLEIQNFAQLQTPVS
jgi:YgiT-type zinc finger domain-containing protein